MAFSKPTQTEALALLFHQAFSRHEGISGIPVSNILTETVMKVKLSDNLSVVKRTLTRRINRMIRDCRGFKIGRTSAPEKRSGKYEKYKTMQVLCAARQDIIQELEDYYIHRFLEDPRNDNKNRGSAGPAGTTIDGRHYLYVVMR